METFYFQILNIVTTSPGNLAYHLVLAFAVAGALQGVFSRWQADKHPRALRVLIGLTLILLGRMALFLAAGFAWTSPLLLPVLDRAVTAISIVIFAWLWNFPTFNRTVDATSALLIILLSVLAVFNFVWGTFLGGTTPFHTSWFNLIWEAVALFLLIMGMGLILIRKPENWGMGLGMLGILTMGHVLYVLLPPLESDFPGIVRLAQLAAYPLLFGLPYQVETTETQEETPEPAPDPEKKPLVHERRRHEIDLPLLQDIFKISPSLTSEDLQFTITQLVSKAMLADLSLLITYPNPQGEMKICCGYDLIREEYLQGIVTTSEELPLLSTAFEKDQTLRLPGSSTSPDFIHLSKLLRLGKVGHLLAVPLKLPHIGLNMGVILLSPYSNRHWGKDDEQYLVNLTNAITEALTAEISPEVPDLQEENTRLQQTRKQTQKQLEEAQTARQALKQELRALQEDLTEAQKQAEDLERLQENVHQSREIIATLEVEKKELQDQVKALKEAKPKEPEADHENELRLALQEIALLKEEIEEYQQKVSDNEKPPPDNNSLSEAQLKSISKLTQELRQPLASMVGYTDILLEESVGLLGSLQKQFLERIRASTERIGALLDGVLEKAAIDPASLGINPYVVELSGAIDQAITEVQEEVLNKKISIRVDLPKKLPRLNIDEYSLHQILVNLLKNATAVTPAEGEILIRARNYDDVSQQDFALIQVADEGGGIPTEDLPHVFSRLYKNSRSDIQGVSDQEGGLSIVKALVEAQQGRAWVDSKEDVGATVSLLIPIAQEEREPL
jgi:signal transduction histidine kinase